MERRYGVEGTVCDGVFFTESDVPGATIRRRIAVEISRQNSNLTELKRAMAAEARAARSVAIMNFRYGQKAHSWIEQLFTFKWDTESWHGSGDAIEEPNSRV
jgi:hypothetical protein